MQCICGLDYIQDEKGAFCPHCFPTRKGMRGVRIASDEVFQTKRIMVFENHVKAVLVYEVRASLEADWAPFDVKQFEGLYFRDDAFRYFTGLCHRYLITDKTPVNAA